MGNCIYCGKPAGLFRSRHAECQEANARRMNQQAAALAVVEKRLENNARSALDGSTALQQVQEALQNYIQAGRTAAAGNQILVSAWCTAVDKYLEDGLIDETEQQRLVLYLETLGITHDKPGDHFNKMVKGVALHELFSGKIPERYSFNDRVPVNLQSGEKIVWAYPDTKYCETRTRIERVGGSQGVSLRIMSGVYYRVGAFKSRPIETTETRHLDTGWLIITDRNLYFAGQLKTQRIPYGKIVAFDPYTDGFGIMRDAQTAKPQLFINGDGWFAYNLLTNLAQR